jgi:hypothetical protein
MTVVLTCRVSPATTIRRMASSVASKWPGTPRTPSWTAAVAPSRLIDTVETPLAAMRSMIDGVNRGVTDGDNATGTPRSRAWATSSNRSGRLRQSPPVRTRIGYGRPKPATWSIRSSPSAVSS